MDKEIEKKLVDLARNLIDQERGRVIIEPYGRGAGFWFGAGKIRKDKEGRLVLTGRYRSYGDSRLGTKAGERGLELAVFLSEDDGKTFEKIRAWSKKDLGRDGEEVLSIEGSCLYFGEKVELFFSLEKKKPYPEEVKGYQKEGTGIWEIEVMEGESIEDISNQRIRDVLSSTNPGNLHLKDPLLFDLNGRNFMIFCQHPFCWTCSYSGLAVREGEKFRILSQDILPRGYTWDVAVTRITERLPIPALGILQDLPPISLYFYDGAECMKEHPQSERGVRRPRGYSCEEIGGLAYGMDSEFPILHRLSLNFPLFCSPEGTGSSRYVSAFLDEEKIYAIWQRSFPDLSQPLVLNVMDLEEVERMLR